MAEKSEAAWISVSHNDARMFPPRSFATRYTVHCYNNLGKTRDIHVLYQPQALWERELNTEMVLKTAAHHRKKKSESEK